MTGVDARKCASAVDSSDKLLLDCDLVKLYNLTADPFEQTNVASLFPEVVQELKTRLQHYRDTRPVQPKLWMQFRLADVTYTHLLLTSTLSLYIPVHISSYTPKHTSALYFLFIKLLCLI